MKPHLILLTLIALAVSAFAQTPTYYVPPNVTSIRAMVVGGTPLAGGTSQIWRDFCAAQRVGLVQAVTDMPTVAASSGHPEIANAAFVTCGTSAGASAAASTAIANPGRAIAVVGLHGVMLAAGNTGFNVNRSGENNDFPTLDFSGVYGVPMIHNFDNNDGFVCPVVLQGLVEWGRAHSAPWTFFIHNDGTHTDNNTALTTLIFPWLAAVLDARLPANAGTGDGTVTLNALTESSGWLGDIKTKTIASFTNYAGDKTKADWFPNQSVATIWSGYHFAPPYSIPAQPVVAPGGIIADLTILDPANNDTTSGTGWKIITNLKEADQTGSLVKCFIMAAPPASVAGLDWIRPIQPGHNYSAYTADPIFTFRVTADATVFIAHSDQITTRPAWLSSWTNTGEQMVVTSGNLTASAPKHTLFKKDFAANAIVTCGGNGTGSGTMYLTMVKPLGTQALPSVSVSATVPNATEGGANGQFTIARTGATTDALTVNFSTGGTAASGVRYVALGTSVVIPAGQSSATVTVATINDNVQQVTETVVLTLAANAAYNLGSPTSATVNILDDDSPPLPVVTVADTITTAAEPSTPGQFTITRTGATTNALTVNFTVTGSATSGVDYVSLGTSAVIPAGQSSVALAVTPIDDLLVEGTETVTLSISSSATYALGTITTASVNILDNDTSTLPVVTVVASQPNAAEPSTSGQWTVSRTGSTTSALVIAFTTTGTAARAVDYTLTGPAGTNFTIPAGQSSAVITLNVVNDTLVEGTETAIFNIATSANYSVGSPSSATISIADDDGTALPSITIVATNPNAAEPSTTGTFTLTRTGATTSALTVNYAISGTATNGTDYQTLSGSVSIAAGQTTAAITVTPIDNLIVDGTRTVIATLSTNANYTLGATTSATVNIADNDGTALPSITIVATNSNAAEPSITGTFTVTRTGATTSALSVNYAISGTAVNGTDYQTLSSSVNIAAGQATAAITLTPIDNLIVDGTRTVILTLSAHAAYTVGSPASATVNIADNDGGGTQPIITVTSTDAIAGEGGSDTGNITITRSGSTTSALTVQLSYGGTAVNGTDYTTLPASISIAAGSSTATLTLTPIDDALVEGAEIAVISAVAGAGYTLGAPAYTSIRINDNDNAAPLTTTGVVFATHVSGANTRDIKLNVYRPATGSGPWPVIIYFPGGGWTSQTEGSVPQFLINFTASGYAVVSANYITSSFAKWPAQIQDTKAAVRWVRANAATYGFDPARIGLTGSSSGGHMTAYTGLTGGLKTARCGSEVIDLIGGIGGNFTQSDAVQAVAPFYPPTDLLAMDRYPTPDVSDHNGSSPETGLIGFPIQTVPEKTGTANPIIHVRAGVPPFWITQGTADRSVDFNQSELLNAALVNAGQPVTFWPVLNAGHGTGVIDNQEVFLLLRTFFDRTLKGIATNALPVPGFTATALSGTAPLTVTFDGSASTAPAGAITKYSWSSGDDNGGGNATLTYTFAHAGTYPVTLAVQDDKGGTASAMQNVVVSPAGTASATPPTIIITSPTDGAWYARTGDLSLQTTAAANGGATVSTVEYFLNGQSVAWDTKSPYIATFGRLAPGAYTAFARVSDSTGAAMFSAPVSFHVFSEADVFPLPSLSAGAFGASYYRFTDGTLNYSFERSDNLTAWTPFTPTQSILTNGTQIQLMQATDPLSASGVPRRFLRVKISTVP